MKNFALLLVSSLIAIALGELALRADGRYESQASQVIGNSHKIWDRSPNSIDTARHPDLDIIIPIVHDEFGARKSSKSFFSAERVVGVFGDSFTENRAVLNEFTFTEQLNELATSTAFVNFGVHGYGLDQSIQHWMDKASIVPMQRVLYVFCANDFRNLYETNIFDRQLFNQQGVLKNVAPQNVPIYVSIASKLHLSYLALEAWYKSKSLTVDRSDFAENVRNKVAAGRRAHRARYHDEYADSMTQAILREDPSEDSMEWAEYFRALLLKWSEMLKVNGTEFAVIVLPRSLERDLSEILIPTSIETIQLDSLEKYEQLEDKKWRFVNDSHWNEYGNLGAAVAIYEHFAMEDPQGFVTREMMASKVSKILDRIDDLYK